MTTYNPVSPEFLAEVEAVIGKENVFTDPDKLDMYKTDEEYDPRRFRVPEAVVRPGNAEEIAGIVKLCNKYMVPITVRSGGTSLADGAIAVCGGIILLMERLNKIIEMNTEGMYVIAEAGVRTVDIQKMANDAGFLYAGDPCSAESCMIGANLATNAGGNKAVRYGVTRNQVYGLEMVTPEGEIVEVGARLKKCSTGYCMEQLVMGSEGTLGIITKVTLKLQPMPPYRFDVLAVFEDPHMALSLVAKINKAGINPTSIEYMDNSYAEAGVRTVDIQKMANDAGFLYAGDPCSAESCMIGANLATNAGGNKAVRYGVTRNQVYGLEMVTPEGEIVEVGARLKKCSTGYCMEQLVMGSEGTLGIITKVTLKLQPMPPYRFDVLAVFEDPHMALSLVAKINKAGINPTSIEYMDNSYVRATADYIEFKGAPHYETGIYVIITVETFTEEELDTKMEQLSDLCEEAGAVDVLEADDRIWAMRRNCQESISLVSKVSLTDDVVVPVDKIASTIKEIMEIGEKYPFPIPVKINAHIGDGNLHIVLCKCDMTDEDWEKYVHEFHEEVYAYAYAQGGRLTGEHGIGAKKLAYMEEFTPAGELELMRKIKRAWDPNNILNPGKVFNA